MSELRSVTLVLPWCPSVNHYWFAKGNRRFIGAKGKAFREEVAFLVMVHGTQKPLLSGRLSVSIGVRAPDRRARDLDNICKAPLDALQHAGVYESDSQIDELKIVRGPVHEGGELIVYVAEIA